MTIATWGIEDLQAALRNEEQVWVRTAAAVNPQADGTWQVHFMELTTGAPPPSWTEAYWEYKQAVLMAACESGDAVARWVKEGRVPFGARSVEWKVQERFPADRHASNARSGGYGPLPWPCLEMAVTSSAPSNGPGIILVADDAPPFFDLGYAAASLFGLDVQPGRMVQTMQSSFRRQDLSGRICGVTVTPTQLTVRMEGSNLTGTIIDLGTPIWHQRASLSSDSEQTVTFDLSGSLPLASWVVLHRADEWLDIRYLNHPYSISKQVDVEFEVEPATRLDALVAAGEGPTTEFKEVLPPTDPKGIRKSLKTVAAFANGDGGMLLYGVNDDGDVVGINKAQGVEERLANLVRTWVSPLPEFSIEALPVDTDLDLAVYVIVVAAGSQTPYGCGTAPTNVIYYLRRGSTTFAISPQDLRETVLARLPGAANQALSFLH